MKKRILGSCLFLLLFCLFGCGQKGGDSSPSDNSPIKPSGILVPTAEFVQVKAPFDPINAYCWVEDTLIYREYLTPEGSENMQSFLQQAPIDAGTQPAVLKQTDAEEEYLYLFFTDRDDNLYLFGMRLSDESLYLQKQSAAGEILYCNYFPASALQVPSPAYLTKGFADSSGNVLLLDQSNGIGYFFNTAGEYIGASPTELSQGALVTGQDGASYLWQQDYQSVDDIMLLQRADMERGYFGAAETRKMTDFLDIPHGNYALFSGYEQGILLSTSRSLWRYDPESSQGELLLDWQDANINIDGSCVEDIRFADWQSSDLADLEVLLYDWRSSVAESARIVYVDQAYLPQKQTVLLGVSPYADMDRLVLGFNRNSREYSVELITYDTGMLEEAMMYGSGQIPDLLDIQWITPELLAGKGLLEDLEPYFENSSVVSREDLLPAVWEAGFVGDRFCGAVVSFNFYTLDCRAENLSAQGWTTEDFFALEEDYPESRPLEYYQYSNVFRILTTACLDDFIDWEEKTCSFDSEEFIRLLEQMGTLHLQDSDQINYPKVTYQDDEINAFTSGEFLIRFASYYSPYDYHTTAAKYQGQAKSVGYPTTDGSPFHVLDPRQQLAIYSNSQCKDGAWAFIEYLLSEAEQSWYGESGRGFPVRKDCFEAYLDKPHGQRAQYMWDAVTKQEKDALRFMAEHMYVSQSINNRVISEVLFEEIDAFLSGDKTAPEAAEIIQNRIQLYFNEM